MRGVVTYDTFRAVVDRAMSDPTPPDAVVATGDLVQDETRAGYERFRAVLEPFGIPVLCIPGNHDAPNAMAEVLSGPSFRVGGSTQTDGWSLILLDTFSRGDDAGRLSDGELDRLKVMLERYPDRHTLVCLHHQPVPMGSRWLDGVGLRNPEPFLAIIDAAPQVRGILWGHVHQASDRTRNGVRLMSTPSTCSQFLPHSDTFAVDGRPPGFRWLNLMADGTIESEVVWLD